MRSAEEWAKACSHLGGFPMTPTDKVMCLDCARAYARECVEAWREKAIKLADDWPAECLEDPGQQNCGPGIAEALHALPGAAVAEEGKA